MINLGAGKPAVRRRLSDQPLPSFFEGHHRLLVARDMKRVNLVRDREGKPKRLARDGTPAPDRQEHDRRFQADGIERQVAGDLASHFLVMSSARCRKAQGARVSRGS